MFIAQIGEADFGADDEQAVAGEDVTHRAEPVAVEFCTDHLAIAENERGGTVPRFLAAGGFFEVAAQLDESARIGFPGRRNHAQHRGGDVVILAQENF